MPAPPASADDPAEPVREIPAPTPGAQLLGISTAPDGTIWFTDDGTDQVGHYDPDGGQFRLYPVKTKGGELWGILQDSTGTVWYTSWFLEQKRGLLGRLDPQSGEVMEFEIPGELPWAFYVLEYRESIWLPIIAGNTVARFDPDEERFQSYPLPRDNQGPAFLAVGPEGDLWVSLSYEGRLARLDPETGRYQILGPGPLESPVGLLWDREGYLWVGDHGASRIVRYDPRTDRYELFPTSQSFFYPLALPNDLAQDAEGRIWFIQHGGNRMAYYRPEKGVLVEMPIPSGEVNAQWMTLDGRERPWFAEYSTGMLGTVDPKVEPALELRPLEGPIRLRAGSAQEVSLPVSGRCGPGTSQVVFTSSVTYFQTGGFGGGLEAAFEPAFSEDCPGEFRTTLGLRTEPDVEPGRYRLRVGVSDGTFVVSRYVDLKLTAGPAQRFLAAAGDLARDRPLLLAGSVFAISFVALLLGLALFRRRGSRRG